MGKRDTRVDAYIARSADFAKPVLRHVRDLVHATCPEVEETLKWGFPHFMYDGILCSMAAFKEHCALLFWKRTLILDGKDKPATDAMERLGKIYGLADLPSDRVLSGYMRQAMKLNEDKTQPTKTRAVDTKPVVVPAILKEALRKSPKAFGAFDSFSPSQRRDYIEWITEAKTDATRQRRLETAIQWMSEGKSRNWKYEKA